MSEHTHTTRTPGCFRCELNLDELAIPPREFYLPDGTWSCVRDHRTTPCGDCDGCRWVQAVNRAGLTS